MTCEETRDRFSEWVDAALGAEERAAVEGHLAGCADCRSELGRLRRTVELLRGIEPARAPAGFVDRVLRAARPTPWYGRAVARLFLPLPVKLPLHAAAVALVAVTVVYLYERTPELQQATRSEAPARAPSEAPPDPGTAPAARPSPAPPLARDSGQGRDAPRGERGRAKQAEPAQELDARTQQAPGQKEGLAKDRVEAERAYRPDPLPGSKTEAPRPPEPPPASPPAAARPTAPPPARPEPAPPARERRADAFEEQAAKRADREAFASRGLASPDVSSTVAGRLAVGDREAARRALAELLGRVGGTELSRRQEAGDRAADLVEVVVPGAAYAAFVEGLARIGRWVPEREPADLSASVRVALRITE